MALATSSDPWASTISLTSGPMPRRAACTRYRHVAMAKPSRHHPHLHRHEILDRIAPQLGFGLIARCPAATGIAADGAASGSSACSMIAATTSRGKGGGITPALYDAVSLLLPC